jgi:hypothetical protein
VIFSAIICQALPAFASAATPLDALKAWLSKPSADRSDLQTADFSSEKLTKVQAAVVRQMLWDDHVAQIKKTRGQEWNDKAITIGSHTLKLLTRHFGEKPKAGWNLFISMHGGGNAPPAVNDQQWQNQIRLYKPVNSVYIAPRAPTDTWNLWHENHIDGLFDRLIEDAIVLEGVDPDHVYLMGYSAGGDGVYQLAPRMADRFAAAAMMAGHPNDASPLGLRNIGFTIHVGALDDGYGRNKIAGEWKDKLDALQKDDPRGYVHEVQLHPGRAHWMNLEDAVAVPWMLNFTRNPIPDKVVWKQGNAVHDRFYWLAVPMDQARTGQLIIASRDGQTINIEKADGVKSVTLLLNDAMLNLDQPVVINMAGKQLFKGTLDRTIGELQMTLDERGDPGLVFSASKTVEF